MENNSLSGIFSILFFLWTFTCTFGLVTLEKIEQNGLGRASLNVNPGDRVRIVAPAGKGADTATPLIKAYVESIGLVPIMSDDIYSSLDPFYANSDEYRANDLINALMDETVKIIWCVRGGAGSIRLIPYLEERLPSTLNHKIFIGYSDITVLHLYLQKKYGWETLQGPMLEAIAVEQYDRLGESVVSLENLIFERQERICLPMIKLDENVAMPVIESEVVGGNAALVEAGIGTLWQVNAEEKILFLEDVGEAAYSIERSLDHMKQSGIFDHVHAVIFSDFTRADNDTLMNFVFERFAKSASFPVFRVTGMGYGTINYPLPFSTFTEIRLNGTDAYNFCVDNIQATQDNSNNSSVRNGGNNSFLKGLIIGIVAVCSYLKL